MPQCRWLFVLLICLFGECRSQGHDPCSDQDAALQSINWQLSCQVVQSDYYAGISCSNWAGSFCPVSCGYCELLGAAAPDCTEQEIYDNKNLLAEVMRDILACPGDECFAAPASSNGTAHMFKAPANLTGAQSGGYTTTDPRDPCGFPGVSCDRCGAVLSIMFGMPAPMFIPGFLPEKFYQLVHLHGVWLQQLEGMVPKDAPITSGNTSAMTSLCTILIQNIWKSETPMIAGLPQLSFVQVLRNEFYGDANNLLGGSGVIFFYVDYTEFVNWPPPPITDAVCQMTRMENFLLVGPVYSGEIPDCPGAYNQLTQVWFPEGILSGPISRLMKSPALQYFDVRRSSMTGTIPQAVSNFTELYDITLPGNKLSGPIPDLSKLTALTYLDFSGNSFTKIQSTSLTGAGSAFATFADNLIDEFPAGFFNIKGFTTLDLSNNLIPYWPPAGVYARGYVTETQTYNFCGAQAPLLEQPFNWSDLETLKVSGNPLLGQDVRDVLGSLAFSTTLRTIELDGCGLAMDLPLEGNQLLPQWDVPNCIGFIGLVPFQALVTLRLARNQIVGFNGPPWKSVQTLDLSNNALEFMHPTWLSEGPLYVDLRGNGNLTLPIFPPNSSLGCPAGTAALRGRTGGYLPTLSSAPISSECTDLCTTTRIIYVDSAANSTSLCRCRAGYYGIGEDCTKCLADEYSDTAGALLPSHCPEHSSTLGEEGSTSIQACKCDAGYVLNLLADGTSACEACPANTFRDRTGGRSLADCFECNAGETSLPGSVGCMDCPNGSIAAPGGNGAGCFECPPGTVVDSDACSPCARGKYQSMPGQTSCELCPLGMDTWRVVVSASGDVAYTSIEGATSNASCGCAEDSMEVSGECLECGSGEREGLNCPGGLDASVITLQAGYYSGLPISVFECFGEEERCPAGRKPGDPCLDGREGFLCALCEDGKIPADDGTCKDCEGSSSVVAPVAILLVVLLAIAFYLMVDKNSKTQALFTENIGIMINLMSLFVGVLQQVGVISAMAVLWPDPLKGFLQALQVLTFDVELFQLGCLGKVEPLTIFVMRLLMIFFGVVLMCIIHVVAVAVRFRGDFKQRKATLITSIGTVSTVFYIAVVTTMSGPLQCQSHPNGKWTVRSYHSVECWDSDTHTNMVVLGLLALIIPLGYLAGVCYIVAQFPSKVRLGDQSFLDAYRFLFIRFKPEAYWYVVVQIVRSLVLSLLLVIPNPHIFALLALMVLLISILFTTHWLPWSVKVTNAVDILFGFAVILLLSVANIYAAHDTGMESSDRRALAVFCLAFMLAAFSVAPGLVIWKIYTRLNKRKPFDFFLCHHKVGAGAFVRLLKIVLAQGDTHDHIFVDSDNLENLTILFKHVREETSTVVAVATRELLFRPWCAGEITVSRLAKVAVVPVHMYDFHQMLEPTIMSYPEHVDISPLIECGLSLEAIQESFRWFNGLHFIKFCPTLSRQAVEELSQTLKKTLGKELSQTSHMDADAISQKHNENATTICILPDHNNNEAVASGMVLLRMMVPVMAKQHESSLPYCLPEGISVPRTTEMLICIFTGGCLESMPYRTSMQEASSLWPSTYPIIANTAFRFPTKENLTSLVEDADDSGKFVDFVQAIFKEIATYFEAWNASQAVLTVAAAKVVHEMHRILHTSSTRATSKQKSSSSGAALLPRVSTNRSGRSKKSGTSENTGDVSPVASGTPNSSYADPADFGNLQAEGTGLVEAKNGDDGANNVAFDAVLDV